LFAGPMTKTGNGELSWKEIEAMLGSTQDWKAISWMLSCLYRNWVSQDFQV